VRLPADKCVAHTSGGGFRHTRSRRKGVERQRNDRFSRIGEQEGGKGTASIPDLADLADPRDPSPMRVPRYSARYSARSNCRVFNNDVNERCVSRVRWDSSRGLAAADPIKIKSDLSRDSFPLLSSSLSQRRNGSLSSSDLFLVPVRHDVQRYQSSRTRTLLPPRSSSEGDEKNAARGKQTAECDPARSVTLCRKGVIPSRRYSQLIASRAAVCLYVHFFTASLADEARDDAS